MLISFVSQPALADSCSGKVLSVGVNPAFGTGTIWANVQGVGMRAYCDLYTPKTANFGGAGTSQIAKETCAAMYSTLLTAQTTGKTITLWFSGTGTVTCNANGNANDWFAIFPMFMTLDG